MPANPVNSVIEITQEQFDRASELFRQIDQCNDRITLGTLAEKRKLIAKRSHLIRERQALLALSGEQFEAVKRFAKDMGHQWKAYLRQRWASGNYQFLKLTDDAALLQQVRNERGLVWLENFRLP